VSNSAHRKPIYGLFKQGLKGELDAKGDEKMTLIEMKKYDNTPIILGENWA
jgi:hypothetical protein